MDGRASLLCAAALAFASGCQQTDKNASVEAPEPRSGLFKEKRSPKVELALAHWREKKAVTLRDNPEVQFRELDEARRVYQEVLNYEPHNVEAQCGLGRTYIALNDFERAGNVFRKAIEKAPKQAPLHAEYSVVFSKRNQFEEAVKHLNKAHELDPENQDYQRMLGVNLVCAGQPDAGLRMLTRARGPAAAHYYVARVYHRLEQPDACRRHLQLAVQANPNLAEAREFLAALDQPNGPRPGGPGSRGGLDLQFVTDEGRTQ